MVTKNGDNLDNQIDPLPLKRSKDWIKWLPEFNTKVAYIASILSEKSKYAQLSTANDLSSETNLYIMWILLLMSTFSSIMSKPS